MYRLLNAKYILLISKRILKRENLSLEKLWSRVSRLCKSRFFLCEKIRIFLEMLLNYPSYCIEPCFYLKSQISIKSFIQHPIHFFFPEQTYKYE